MKKFFLICTGLGFILWSSFSIAQEKDSAASAGWEYNLEVDFYFTDPFTIIPIVQADKNKLHLEARYNYEEAKTFSAWAGYNISGGKKFQYDIIPMVGGLAGRINGLAAGLELTFDFSGFELYSESEYIFDLKDKENNFYYNWTDFTYSPFEWLFFGLSAQRTRVYQTDLDLQHGIAAGGSFKILELTAYYYNPGSDDQFFLLAISAGF